MSRMQRDKGKRGELAVAHAFQAEGIPVRRLFNAGGGADLVGLKDYGIWPEVKSQGRVLILDWMRQTETEAAGANLAPTLYWRLCRPGTTSPWYANQLLSDHIDLLKRATA
jgi:hypothetical protein